MSLQRKENNLRRAQARLDRIQNPPRWKVVSHLKAREFQIDYRREPNRHGRYRTRAYIVRGAKAYHGNNRGLIHKAVNLKYRVQGDKPSVTRTIKSWQPKTMKGKLFKANARAVNFAVHDVTQTAVDTALAAETVGLKTSDTAQREVRNELKQKYTREAVDDYHRGVFLMGRTAVDAVKGTHHHLKTKKQHKLEKAKFQLKKADNKLYKAKTGKPKLRANKAALRGAKAEYKAKKKPAHGNKLRKAMNKRRLQAYKQTKRELKFERKQLKTESKFRVKEFHNQKKISKLTRPGLLALKPVSYSAGRMKASAWQKAVNEDQDNDFLHAIDSAKRRVVEPAAQKVSKPQRLQKKEKQRDRLNDKKSKSNNRLSRQESRLKEKHDSYKKRKKPKPKKKKGAKDTISAALKAAWKFVKNVYESEVKKFFLCLAIPVIVILLVFAIFTMIFSATSSHSGFTLGTYAAQDYDLSEAEKYYTELAYNLNQKIRKVGSSSDWKNGLVAFGANTGDLSDTPDEWVWGRSSVYDFDPVYDFDTYKLWSFLCAYYYDFDADNDDIYYLTAIQKICLKKFSMRNMSSSIGTIISPDGRSFPHTTIGAAVMLHREHITELRKMLISMTSSRTDTVSSRLRSHRSFRSMRTMTAISALQTATVCLMHRTITRKQASLSWITAGIPAQATRSTTSTTIPTHFSLCTARNATTAVFGVGTVQTLGSWYRLRIRISGTAV